MKPWAEMSAGGRFGVIGSVAAVVAALFWGAWQMRPVPPEGMQSTGSAETEAPGTEPAAVAGEADAEAGAEAGAETGTEAVTETVTEAVTETADGVEAAPAATPEADVAAAGTEAETVAGADVGADAGADADSMAAPEAEADAGVAADVVATEGSGAGSAMTEAAPEAVEAAPEPPSFDLVRVEKDGSALVAGSALPGSQLSLRVTGAEIAAVPADGQGNFVAMFNLAPSAAPRVLSLVMTLDDGTEVPADGSVVIAPTVAPVVVAASEAAPEAAATTVPAATPEVAEATAPAALLVTDEGAKVLQGAEALPAEMVANVTVDTITYTPEGAVQLAGRGTAERVVRIYLDNVQTGGDVSISTAGDWAVTLPEIAPGIYTLRADQIGADGAVTSRFETPFKRETAEALAAASGVASGAQVAATEPAAEEVVAGEVAAAPAAAEPVTVTVQPGFTLWKIATENLGEGIRYVQVFEANRDQIRDPDLIYPGQVFTIPGAE